jgi:hypothetical protein
LFWIAQSNVLDRAIEKTAAYADNHRDTAVIGCRVLNPNGTLVFIFYISVSAVSAKSVFRTRTDDMVVAQRFPRRGCRNRLFYVGSQGRHRSGCAVKLGAQRAQVTNRSFARYMFKHWPKPRAVIGVYMLAFFYLSRLAILGPKQLLTGQMNDQKLLENHWIGL